MHWQQYDIVENGVRTHVYTVPSSVFGSMPIFLPARIRSLDEQLAKRHPGADVHLGKVIGFDMDLSANALQRLLGDTPAPPAAAYDPGSPQNHEVLCGHVEIQSAEDNMFGRRIAEPVPVFPDHPQYAELQAAQNRQRTVSLSQIADGATDARRV